MMINTDELDKYIENFLKNDLLSYGNNYSPLSQAFGSKVYSILNNQLKGSPVLQDEVERVLNEKFKIVAATDLHLVKYQMDTLCEKLNQIIDLLGPVFDEPQKTLSGK